MPISAEAAASLADSWFRDLYGGERRVDIPKTISRPYGWVFIGTGNYTGGSCLLVYRATGRIEEIGSGQLIEGVLARVESSLSADELAAEPEIPAGASRDVPGNFGIIRADQLIDVGAWPEAVRTLFLRTRSNDHLWSADQSP